MAIGELKLNISVKNMEVLTNFLELLGDNSHLIKPELIEKIKLFAEKSDIGWVNWSDISPLYINNNHCQVIVNGEDVGNVTAYNEILKKVKIFHCDPNRLKKVKADSFKIINTLDNSVFVEW